MLTLCLLLGQSFLFPLCICWTYYYYLLLCLSPTATCSISPPPFFYLCETFLPSNKPTPKKALIILFHFSVFPPQSLFLFHLIGLSFLTRHLVLGTTHPYSFSQETQTFPHPHSLLPTSDCSAPVNACGQPSVGSFFYIGRVRFLLLVESLWCCLFSFSGSATGLLFLKTTLS